MAALSLTELEEIATQLAPTDRLRLAESLLQSLHAVMPQQSIQRRKWSEIRGMVPCPYLGEDAQAWITRGRMEGEDGLSQEKTP